MATEININYSREPFVLTKDESDSLSKKIKLFNDFMEVFDGSVSVSAAVAKSFTFREILSDEGLDFLISKLLKKRGIQISHFVLSKTLDGLDKDFSFTDVVCRLIEKNEILGSSNNSAYFRYVESSAELLRKLIGDKSTNGGVDLEELFIKLCDSGAIKYISTSCQIIKNILEELLSKKEIKNPLKLIQYIENNYSSFNEYPLILMNPSIEKSVKQTVLKKKYRQKDLPAYIKLFQEANDLSIIDDFIESTIISNNRVKEKDQGIVNLFKYIFFSKERHINFSKFINAQSFGEKYKKYLLDREFIKKMYSSLMFVGYTRRVNAKEFMKMMFNGCTPAEILDITINFSKYLDSKDLLSGAITNELDKNNIDGLKFIFNNLEITKNTLAIIKNLTSEKISSKDRVDIEEAFFNRLKIDNKSEFWSGDDPYYYYNNLDESLFYTVKNNPVPNDENDLKEMKFNCFLNRNYISNIADELENLKFTSTASDDLTKRRRILFIMKEYFKRVSTYLDHIQNKDWIEKDIMSFLNKYVFVFNESNIHLIAEVVMSWHENKSSYSPGYYSKSEMIYVIALELAKNLLDILKKSKLLLGNDIDPNNIEELLENSLDSTSLILNI